MENIQVVLLGDSFIQHLRDFCRDYEGDKVSLDMGLSATLDLRWLGVSGRTLDKVIRFDLSQIQPGSYQAVVLHVCSNDLTDPNSTPHLVAHKVNTILIPKLKELGFKVLVLCEVFFRHHTTQRTRFRKGKDLDTYNSHVLELNQLLKAASYPTGITVQFWSHDCVIKKSGKYNRLWSKDGVHLNREHGLLAFYRSIRGAVIRAGKLCK